MKKKLLIIISGCIAVFFCLLPFVLAFFGKVSEPMAKAMILGGGGIFGVTAILISIFKKEDKIEEKSQEQIDYENGKVEEYT